MRDADRGSDNAASGQGGASGQSAASGQGAASGQSAAGPGKVVPPGGAAGDGGARALGHPLPTCTSPKSDATTGLVTCAEGYRYRERVVACGALTGQAGEPAQGGAAGEPSLPRADGTTDCSDGGVGGAGGAGGAPAAGSIGAERCSGFARGYCKTGGDSAAFGVCESGCVTDAECGPGFICLCDDPQSPTGGACHPSNCQTDAGCGDGYHCASYDDGCSSGFACQTPNDECFGDTDPVCNDLCSWDDAAGKRRCQECSVGRPFLVESTARQAPIMARHDWLAGVQPNVDHLTLLERTKLAEHWTRAGQMEHASIAAFARFSLQLLALGAPPELLDACTQALADETAHAKLCFGIASAYAGRAIGPGLLDISHSLEAISLVDIVDLVIIEGCFGETSAALEAVQAADAATDPVLARAYSQIAADEQRHAELAFRFVRWALERSGDAVQARIAAAIATPPALAADALAVSISCLDSLVLTLAQAAPSAA